MSITVGNIVTKVRSAIDELMQNDSEFLRQSTDEANLTNVIVDKIGYALQYIMENAPIEKLDHSVYETFSQAEMSQNFEITQDLVGKVKLPDDILRIIEARLSSWSHFPIPEKDTSQVYLMQQDTYARGSYDRPVNILTHTVVNINPKRVLEMYSAKTENDKLIFVFIRKPDAGSYSSLDETVNVPASLEGALVYQVAGLSMVAFREEVAASLFQIADNYMNAERTKVE